MGIRRGPSLEPRRKLGASYGKETRNGGPYNVSACDGPRGHTHVHHCRSVALALSRIFRIFWSPCLPRVYRHVISQPRPSPFLRRYHLPRKSKRARNGEGLGPRLVILHNIDYQVYIHETSTWSCSKPSNSHVNREVKEL